MTIARDENVNGLREATNITLGLPLSFGEAIHPLIECQMNYDDGKEGEWGRGETLY